MNVKTLIKDKEERQAISIGFSFLASLSFALFNGYLGIFRHSVWSGGIFVYYLLLLSVRGIIIAAEKRVRNESDEIKERSRKKTFIATSVILFLISIALVVPVSLMVLKQKEVNIGLIPAITVAAYTTYKVTFSIINYVRNRKNKNLSLRQIRTINLIDATLSVLTLQNTLIMVNGGSSDYSMTVLSAVSSLVGIIFIMALPVISIVRFVKENKADNAV